jgi:hypothetical protein
MRISASSREFQVPCKTCGAISTEREVMVHSGTHSRMVSYYHHAECLTDESHIARLNHLKDFFEAMDALAARLAAATQPGGALELETGLIKEIDLGYVCPDACSDYTQAMPIFTVACHGLRRDFRMMPFTVAGVDFGQLVASIKLQAEGVAKSLTAVKESGNYHSTVLKEAEEQEI